VAPFAFFVTEDLRLIDDDFSFRIERHLVALQRTRRRAFEVDAIGVVTRAVTGAFELALGGQPGGDAAQVRADVAESGEAAVFFVNPDAEAIFPTLVHALGVLVRETSDEVHSGLEHHVGIEKAQHEAHKACDGGSESDPTHRQKAKELAAIETGFDFFTHE